MSNKSSPGKQTISDQFVEIFTNAKETKGKQGKKSPKQPKGKKRDKQEEPVEEVPTELKRQRMDILLEADDPERIRKEKILAQFQEEFKDEFFLIKKKEEDPEAEKSTKSKGSKEGSQEEEEDEVPQIDPLESFEKFLEAIGSWKKPLWDTISGPDFQSLYQFLKAEYSLKHDVCVPARHQIFNAYQLCPIEDIKVVILGQDPYMQPGVANGLCFSVNKKFRVPGTLKQIYRCLEADDEIDFEFPNPLHGDLTNWAQQGVFLINSILTSRAFQNGSHKFKGWENFTKETIKQINKNCTNVVYILFGHKAQQTVGNLVDKTNNLVIKEKMPSPKVLDFKESKCFSECNIYLEEHEKDPIDWNL